MTKEEYNNEPIHYCSECLSLKIKTIASDSDLTYCDECGGTDIHTAHINEWRQRYINRYGFEYLTGK